MLRTTGSALLLLSATIAVLPFSSYGQQQPVQVARGARLWNATCNRCHNRRSPTERTDREWDLIVSHMRTRANLTKSEVQAIAAFLKQANGSEPQKGGQSSGRVSDSTAGVQFQNKRHQHAPRQANPSSQAGKKIKIVFENTAASLRHNVVVLDTPQSRNLSTSMKRFRFEQIDVWN